LLKNLILDIILHGFVGCDQGYVLFVKDGDEHLHMRVMEPDWEAHHLHMCAKEPAETGERSLGEFLVSYLNRKTKMTCACGIDFG
jgi:hypothetical protein